MGEVREAAENCDWPPGRCSAGADGGGPVGAAARAEITALHPRPEFKRRILEAFTEGIAQKPATTFGNVKADVLRHFVPGFVTGDFVEVIQGSPWEE